MSNFQRCIAMLLLAWLWSCAGQTVPPEAAPTAAGALRPNAGATARSASHPLQNALMYASDMEAGKVLVYTYPQGRLSMTLTGMDHPRGECVDSAGNVYVTNITSSYDGNIYIFAHGASAPSEVLTFPDAIAPSACSVDIKSDDLAVTNSTSQVFVYDPNQQTWSDDIDVFIGLSAVAYDDRGNLFVGGTGGYGYFSLAEIPKSQKCFCDLSLDEKFGSYTDKYSLQWDGQYLAVTDIAGGKRLTVYRLTVSAKKAKVVGTVRLRRNHEDSFEGGYSWIRGGRIIAPHRAGKALGYWNYFKGGLPRQNVYSSYDRFFGVTVSD
jgi:hypothetical protein